MSFFKKYLALFISLLFSLIGIINSLRFKFPAGTDTFFHYLFSKKILENSFFLPKSIPYFWDNVLAGYPPFFHYSAALISKLFGLDLLVVYKFLPWLFFSLLLLSVYIFIREFDKKYALLSMIIFLLFPIYHHIFYVGEFARLPGLAFALLCLAKTKRYLKTHNKKELILSGVFYSLAILSHLYAAAVISVILIYWIIEQYIVKKDFSIIWTVIIGVIFSSPWLIFIIKNFGFFYFLNVFRTHSTDVASFAPYIAIILLMLPIIRGLYKKKFYSVILIFLILSIISRTFIMVPVSYYLSKRIHIHLFKKNKKIKSFSITILFIISLVLFSLIITSKQMNPYMSEQKLQAADWIKQNTGQNQTIIAFTDFPYINRNISEYLFDKIIGYAVKEINGFGVIVPVFTERNTYSWFAFEWALEENRKLITDEFRKKFCKEHFIKTSIKYEIYPDYLWFAKDKDSSSYNHDLICNDLTEPEFKKVFSNSEVDIYKINY